MIETLLHLDGSILLWIQENLRYPILNAIFIVITTLGNKGAIWIVISLALLIPKKTRRVGVTSLVALLGSLLINNLILKNLVARTRPYENLDSLVLLISKPTDYSFPSGHTGSSFAAACVMARKLPKRYGIPAMILAVLIAFSRLYVGVHYPSDVFVGAISGIIISYLAEFLIEMMVKWKQGK